MRTLSSSMMAALVVAALFFGNCFSCPQMLLAQKVHAPSHDCCKKNQKPAQKNCSARSMHQFVKTDAGAGPVVAAVPADRMEGVAAPVVPASVEVMAEAPAHSPPDLLSLHSTFRI